MRIIIILIKEVLMMQTIVDFNHPETDEQCQAIIEFGLEKNEMIAGLRNGEPWYKSIYSNSIKSVSYIDENGDDITFTRSQEDKIDRVIEAHMDDL
jgi:hypothetical protein